MIQKNYYLKLLMCGIAAIYKKNKSTIKEEKIYKLIKSVQHRGQDSYGYSDGKNVEKYMGMIKNPPENLTSNITIAHTRYRTSGIVDIKYSQPIKVNNLTLVHNGNIEELEKTDKTDSYRLTEYMESINNKCIINTIKFIINSVKGSFFIILIYKDALYAFKDKKGIRPGLYGVDKDGDILICSENNYDSDIDKDILPGEILEIKNGKIKKYSVKNINFTPCIFEYIYLCHPKSTIYGLKVEKFRIDLGRKCKEILKNYNIDVVCGVPKSARIYALEIAKILDKKYIEPKVKDKRSFILPTQKERENYVNEKFTFKEDDFNYDHVLIVDDSIVRGTTSKVIIKKFKEKGCKVSFLSCSPKIVNVNRFGINITTKKELISYNRSLEEIKDVLGCDNLFYQTIDNLYSCSGFKNLELSIFK